MAAVTIDALEKVYPNGTQALHPTTLEIPDGELVVLVGPSGCGKSTLLRAVAGLEDVTRGEIRIGGERVNDVDPARRDIAMVFQNYALYPHMTVRENMTYGLRNRGVDRGEIRRRVDEGAALLGIAEHLDKKPSRLSGGQRQRVAMGRAIVREPAVFLFDEPLSNLDARLRNQMRVEIRRLQRRLGTTSIYVTHDQTEAMTMADRLVVLDGGRVEQVGTPLEVYRRPASTFVAQFIGVPGMNLLPATVRGDVAIIDGASGAREPIRLAAPPGDGPVLLGFRAEDAVAAHEAARGALDVAVTVVEELGAGRLVHAELEMGGDALPIVITRDADAPLGDRLRLEIPPGAWHVFDRDSGRRVSLNDDGAPAASAGTPPLAVAAAG